jgi:GH25 family lysozyme M1 (1,4-beta-N-acetylmuramidase)
MEQILRKTYTRIGGLLLVIIIAAFFLMPETALAATATATAATTTPATPKFALTAPTASQSTIYVRKGTSISLAGRYPVSGDKVKSYSSSKKKVATVSSKGKLKALKVGKTTITVKTKKGKKDTIRVNVVAKKKSAKKITITKKKTIEVKKIYRPSVRITPAKSTDRVKYSISNKKIATVNAAGYITAKKAGKVTITVKTTSGKKAKLTLTVKAAPKPPASPAPKPAPKPPAAKPTLPDPTPPAITVTTPPVIVDLSKWQGDIDWTKAKDAIDLAILRVVDGVNVSAEPKYSSYSASCIALKIPFGVYSYVRYKTSAAAITQAEVFYETATADGQRPLFFAVDIEASGLTKANTDVFVNKLRELANTDYGGRVKVALYISQAYYKSWGLTDDIQDLSDPSSADFIWIPRYGKNTGTLAGSYQPIYPCDMWQYTSVGTIPGITGNVDMNTIYDIDNNLISSHKAFNFEWLIQPGPATSING